MHFSEINSDVAINLSLELSPFRPRIARTMPHLRQCDAIAAGRYPSRARKWKSQADGTSHLRCRDRPGFCTRIFQRPVAAFLTGRKPCFDHAMQYAKSVRLFERLSLRD